MAIIAQFEKCPWCGSSRRLSDHILGLAKAKGQVSPGFKWYPIVTQLQPPSDPIKPPLIGTVLITATLYSDVCLDCGRSYPVKIIESGAQVTDVQITGKKL